MGSRCFQIAVLAFLFFATSHHILVCLHSEAVDSGKNSQLITRQGHKENCL